jgi:hypothetical protein
LQKRSNLKRPIDGARLQSVESLRPKRLLYEL